MVKRDDIGFQHANNVVTVKWFDNCGVTMIGTCLVECNKVSTVTRKVKRQSTKIPVPCPETAAYKFERHLVGVITLDYFFIDGYLCCKCACNLQRVVPKGNGITRFKTCPG